jgi:hypothetical protein
MPAVLACGRCALEPPNAGITIGGMAENESFFRKVVRFVANPATDWNELNSKQEDSRELELEKSELKAMIERKRRNDFVRKREFDMLRKVRREGLSPEQMAALGGSSRLDDSEARLPDAGNGRPDAGVKAKIDEIEQQMVGDGLRQTPRRPATAPLAFTAMTPGGSNSRPGSPDAVVPSERSQLRDEVRGSFEPPFTRADAMQPTQSMRLGDPRDDDLLPALPPLPELGVPPAASPAPVQMAAGLPPLSPMAAASFDLPSPAPGPMGGNSPFGVEVSEVVHDPELDEAVIAFANADFTQCEQALQQLTGLGGARAQHAETWLVLFDLYRATGQQQRFETLAMDYAHSFGWSAPQWYSLPKLVADALADEPVLRATASTQNSGDVGWVSPPHLDIESVARLRSQTLQMPLPWVLDWSLMKTLDPEAAMQLSTLFRVWAGQALDMRWVGGERLFHALQDAAPTGLRDADPAFWLTRLDALRLANRVDQFDEAAIDYCVTYEVSPPSWEAARCKVRISSVNPNTNNPASSVMSEVSTSFLESSLFDDGAGAVEMAHVELSGQLTGDIGGTLRKLDTEMNAAPIVAVSCARLIRVDFIAAGDLLNWVLNKRNENRAVHFVDAHRLVALFFGAMGINEHAKVQIRRV